MNDLIKGFDSYLEHEQHIVGESGKRVPFFRNKKNCSTCYSNWKKITDRSKLAKLFTGGSSVRYEDINFLGNPNYAR